MATVEKTLTSKSRSAKVKTQALELQECIETAIIQGEFSAGERLDETRLAQRFGVSRTPVREALKGLAAARLVVIRPHAGVFVASPALDEIMEMFELMAMLEAFAASQAARRATDQELVALRKAHRECRSAAKGKDPAIFFVANQVFHGKIYAMAHNSALYETIMALDKRLAPYRRLITFRTGRVEESIDEHGAILVAIEQSDSDSASHAMGDHLGLLAEDARALARAARENHALFARQTS